MDTAIPILFAALLAGVAIYSTIRRERRIAADLAELARWRTSWASMRDSDRISLETLEALGRMKAYVDQPDYGGAIGGA